MKPKTYIYQGEILLELNDNLVIHFETENFDEIADYKVAATLFFNRDKRDIYLIEPLLISTPSHIDHTFQNGIHLKGWLELRPFIDQDSKDAVSVFANLYYQGEHTPNSNHHFEGILLILDK